MLRLMGLFLGAALFVGTTGRAQETSGQPDPALSKLGELVGGRWVGKVATPQGEMPVESRYRWILGGKVLHAISRIGVGTPAEFTAEAFYGWDAARKQVYYFDLHGHQDVFQGTVKMNGNLVESDFKRLVGPAAHWVATDEMPDKNTLVFTLYSVSDGEKRKLFSLTSKREAETPLPPGADAPAADVAPSLKALGLGVGGRWRNEGGQVNLTYTWAPGGRVLRCSGTIFGTPLESRCGWDPVAKKTYYLDFHGPDRLFFGHFQMDGEDLVAEFRTLVGPAGSFKSRGRFMGDDYDALVASTAADSNESHRIRLKRER